MSNSKSLQPGKPQKMKFSQIINSDNYKELIRNTLNDPERAKRFVAAITSAVATNQSLQECTPGTIMASAFLGESLNLSPSPQLGQYYLVPFKKKAKFDRKGNVVEPEVVQAQFILGYKGYLQLAMRSGQLKKINALEIKEGELIRFDPLNEEIECKLISDWNERDAAPTIGYYAFFELSNGFRKAIYWSKEQMISHADKYSMAFSAEAYEKIQKGEVADRDMWKYLSFWYKNFDEMARKTMLRQLISKGGCPMSAEMITAYERDNSVSNISDDNKVFVEQSTVEISPAQPAPYNPDESESIKEQIQQNADFDDFVEEGDLDDF